MADTTTSRDVGATTTSSMSRSSTEPSGWVGWILFAGSMLMLVGSFHIIEGFVALFKDEYYLVPKSGLLVSVDYTTWGWVHMLGGALLIGVGAALFSGKMWARVLGVGVCLASALVNAAFLSAYPVWSAIMIGLDVICIWAITVHGDEMKAL